MDKSLEARKLFRENSYGVLSTISLDVEGYPFGSVTPYCLSNSLEPLLLISNIAQHTKNILANSKVSLTVFNNANSDVQAGGRITYVGDAIKTDLEEDKTKYATYFPKSKEYFGFHDFSVFKIQFKRVRFIGGFGNIFWLDEKEFAIQNPLLSVSERIITHMNDDHHDSIIKYCRVLKNLSVEEAKIISIDSEGFDVLADNNFVRFNFDEPVNDAVKAREVFVKMSQLTTTA
ncbi:MAG: DUF2470 domain-containing protein [Candidatus Sericytochromatia bacterium]|nr:DUF2470 domain-containing protein [Candidatus Sericytochromatia bacterium]